MAGIGGTAGPALLSAMAGLSALPASPYQVQRVRREIEALSSAAPGSADTRPPWEYLSLGHLNAYSPALAALDAVDGFELSPSSAADPELRRAQRLAALAAALLHDIAAPSPSGLTAAIARADGLGPGPRAAARRRSTTRRCGRSSTTPRSWPPVPIRRRAGTCRGCGPGSAGTAPGTPCPENRAPASVPPFAAMR